MKQKNIFFILIFCIFNNANAQNHIDSFINKYTKLAMLEQGRSGVPASITLAQAIHESDAGKSNLAQYANNFFGIKCGNLWQGENYLQDDDSINECFRMYINDTISFADHSDFLSTKKRYQSLFLLPIFDYVSWAKGLQNAGYATNIQYSKLIITTIEKYKLYEVNGGKKIENVVAIDSFSYQKITSTFVISTSDLLEFELVKNENKNAVFVIKDIPITDLISKLKIEKELFFNLNKTANDVDVAVPGMLFFLE
jgi:hypothetical protein